MATIGEGDRVLIIDRKLYKEDNMRLFVGVVEARDETTIRVHGYPFHLNPYEISGSERHGEARVRIVSLIAGDLIYLLARELDPMRREMIKWMQDNVESVEQRAGEQLGKARFAVYGKSTYPDATFTLRLSYGTVKGYPMNGTIAPPKTTFYGLYGRANDFDFKPPFNLMPRYVQGRDKLDLATPLDFVTDNDVVGGNSGSPVINRAGDIVGLVFDGNIESLVGDFVYDGETNRTVSVHTAAMTEALRKIYNTAPLLKELLGGE